jgi:hypothetical protein
MTAPVMGSTMEAASLHLLLRAKGAMKAEIGKLLKSPLSPAAREFWTEMDAANALETNAIQRLMEALTQGSTKT